MPLRYRYNYRPPGVLACGSIAIEAPFVSPRLVDREEAATLRAEDGVR